MSRLAAYFSHSWKYADTALNLKIWEKLAAKCQLLVDNPQIPDGAQYPPYYISRIESVFRRADLFVACLPAVAAPNNKNAPVNTGGARGDYSLRRCSHYILFEIRMAERAGLPRFVLYDKASDFRPPNNPPENARYVGVHFEEVRKQIEDGQSPEHVFGSFERWVDDVSCRIAPRSNPYTEKVGLLMSGGTDMISDALEEITGCDAIDVQAGLLNDAHFCERLRSLSLLVADVTDSERMPLYCAAHALLIPTIRICPASAEGSLPWLLRGHPEGYQKDLVVFNGENDLPAICQRAQVAIRPMNPVSDVARGRHILQQGSYYPHFVFLSHASKQDDRMAEPYKRELVDQIVHLCLEQGIELWEYDDQNKAAEDWRIEMSAALEKMTHFVALLTSYYDGSEACLSELSRANEKEIVSREAGEQRPFTILPYLVGGRTESSKKINNKRMTQKRLPDANSPEQNARIIVSDILRAIVRG